MTPKTLHTPDPKCPWCDGDGWTPFLVEHPEDGTTHIEYHPCVCTKPRTFPWSAVVCLLILAAAIGIVLAMCIPVQVLP